MFKQWLSQFCEKAVGSGVEVHIDVLESIALDVIERINQGDLHKWQSAYEQLPDASHGRIDFQKAALSVVFDQAMPESFYGVLEDKLMALHPWRKGPFQIGDCLIDSEWQSNLKWSRIIKGLPELKNKTILDVGCGNGYYLMKMAEYQPKLLLGIEPGLIHNIQYWSVEKYAQSGVCLLPLKIQDMPVGLNCFDVVFSMGVLYHRKSPIAHIEHLKSLISANGSLILETLVVDGDERTCLVPEGRYAQMRNVWFLPSVAMLSGWLKKIGFNNINVVDISLTTVNEQRSTDWMKFHSLKEFLSDDQQLTVEGHPPPKRVVISCQK
ncbi:tRNA 5-methoxyuridine(34)/uridine 5-oxyacetic acid(34) synthase CmoB [Marinicella litoralis]|uniref:tRNA U34 carboxymethyltransferase n=1 Tax=Marinicella litoralis TaxID=644220 RepID=A0A4V3DH00_9GAMM|nr:tRNA 5-methoxyuridine(34)/uridine 5-oxyacetic acid(34) synthase CmoB [Marinicella litoralis]TDR16261.1 tRNA (mo5U34)-methyltransferase [Marinicella litoralis]